MIGRRKRLILWIALAIPAAAILYDLYSGRVLAMDLLHPSGEMAVRLMILAMLPGPLSAFFGHNRFFRAWLAIRRNLGVAAFAYAMLHLAIYCADMRILSAILGEFTLPAIWTGWLALGLLAIPVAISFDRAVRLLRKRWKQIQTLVYPALGLSLIHWLLLDWSMGPAFVHVAPLVAAWLLRGLSRFRSRPLETPKERTLS